MGCDIHMVMEYRAVPGAEDQTPWWWAFGGVCNPGRDYALFNRLAGVRGPADGALIPARGLPTAFSSEVHHEVLLSIADKPLKVGEVDWEGRAVERERAEAWVRGGSSQLVRVGDRDYVTHPDYHSFSWLTLGEYAGGAAGSAHAMGEQLAPGYWAIQAALATFADRGYEARVVFWFDN